MCFNIAPLSRNSNAKTHPHRFFPGICGGVFYQCVLWWFSMLKHTPTDFREFAETQKTKRQEISSWVMSASGPGTGTESEGRWRSRMELGDDRKDGLLCICIATRIFICLYIWICSYRLALFSICVNELVREPTWKQIKIYKKKENRKKQIPTNYEGGCVLLRNQS